MSEFKTVSNETFLESFGTPRKTAFLIQNFCRGRINQWGVKERVLRDHVVWIVITGQLKGDIDGRPVHLLPDDFLWMQPGVPHSFYLPREEALLENYALRFRLIEKGRELRVRGDFFRGVKDVQGSDLLNRALLAHTFPHSGAALKMRYLLGAFLLETLNTQHPLGQERPGVFHLQELRNLNAWLESNLEKGVGPSDLAGFFNLSLDYFSRKFRAHFGLSPQDWLVRERLQRAASLLRETSLSIKEVCHRMGFRDQRFFSRQFKALYKRTPSEYRGG